MKKFSRFSIVFYLHELFHSPFLDFSVNTQNNPISHLEQNRLNPVPRGTNTAWASITKHDPGTLFVIVIICVTQLRIPVVTYFMIINI